MTGSKNFPLLATLFTLIGIGVLCTLGSWQLQRLEWKRELLSGLEEEYRKDAGQTLLGPADIDEKFQFRRGTIRATYLPGTQILIAPRTHDGEAGMHVLAAAALADGSTLLVNRGWAPQGAQPGPPPPDRDLLTGLFRPPPARNAFTPKNLPEENQWYHPDPDDIAQRFGLENIRPYILYLETQDDELFITQATAPNLNNNHLQYAAFWFAMAGVLAVIYVLRFWVIKRPLRS